MIELFPGGGGGYQVASKLLHPVLGLIAGAALIIAALTAQGKTTIEEIYQVDRGYERIEERLQKIGVNIKRVEK